MIVSCDWSHLDRSYLKVMEDEVAGVGCFANPFLCRKPAPTSISKVNGRLSGEREKQQPRKQVLGSTFLWLNQMIFRNWRMCAN
jgi:hypothetical protein